MNSSDYLEAIFQHAAIGIALLDRSGKPLRTNPALSEILGYSSAELQQRSIIDSSHPDDREQEENRFAALFAGELTAYQLEKRYLNRDGDVIWSQLNASPILDAAGEAEYAVYMLQDITDRKRVESDLRAERESLEELWNAATSAITFIDLSGRITRIYPGFTTLFGYTADEAVGRNVQELIVPDDRQDEVADNLRLAAAGETVSVETVRRHKDGRLIHISVLGRAMRRGDRPELFLIYRDISERKEAEAAAHRLSTTDELTSLHNRRGFFTLADQEIKRARRESSGLILIYCDLDDFKRINDGFGHSEGDRALAEFARLLRDCSRGSDVISRFGGDEFVVLASGLRDGETVIVNRIRSAVKRLNDHPGRRYALGVSLGSIYFDPVSEDLDLETLIAKADARMYEDKGRMNTADQR